MWSNIFDVILRSLTMGHGFLQALKQGQPIPKASVLLAEVMNCGRRKFAAGFPAMFLVYGASSICMTIGQVSILYVLGEEPSEEIFTHGTELALAFSIGAVYIPVALGRSHNSNIRLVYILPIVVLAVLVIFMRKLEIPVQFIFMLSLYALVYNAVLLFKSSAIRGASQEAPHFESKPDSEESQDSHATPDDEQRFRMILGVSATATETEVKQAYRILMTKYHPDKVNHLGDEFIRIAEKRAKDANQAYDFLKSKHGWS